MIKIIDYIAGNAPSVLNAAAHLGYKADIARAPADLSGATHIILPGVGSAGATMSALSDAGLIPALNDAVLRRKTLFLGICVGLQILFDSSEEDDAKCLGWLPGRVVRFDASMVRVPQMGWNKVHFLKDAFCNESSAPDSWQNSSAPTPAQDDYFYFVNSYCALPSDESDLWGEADYNGPFAAAVSRDNIYATQFHIEKSGKAGLSLLGSFLAQGIRSNNL